MQVLRLQAAVQGHQAQLTSQAAELDCKAALIADLRNDIAAACSEIETLSQTIPARLKEPTELTVISSGEAPEAAEDSPQHVQRPSISHRLLISLPLLLVKSSLKVGVIAAGTLMAERAYEQHHRSCMQQGQNAARKSAKVQPS